MFRVGATAGRAAVHAVRLQIIPAPRCIADSREILRILQRYGEVTTYRWLKHDKLSSAPNSAMAIFRDAEVMDRFLHQCPLTFEIDRSEPGDSVEELAQEEPEPTTQQEPGSEESAFGKVRFVPVHADASATVIENVPRPTSLVNKPQLFRVKADKWRGDHAHWLERRPMSGAFALDRHSMIVKDLSRRVPVIGLSDLEVDQRPGVLPQKLTARKKEISGRPTLRQMIDAARQDDDSEPGKAISWR